MTKQAMTTTTTTNAELHIQGCFWMLPDAFSSFGICFRKWNALRIAFAEKHFAKTNCWTLQDSKNLAGYSATAMLPPLFNTACV